MNFEFLFIVEAVIVVFFAILMVYNSYKYKYFPSKGIALLLFLIVAKSLLYYGIKFCDVQWYDKVINAWGDTRKVLHPDYMPLYNFKYLIWQYLETLFIISLFYYFHYTIKKTQRRSYKFFKTVYIITLIFISVYFLSILVSSIVLSDNVLFNTNISIIELLKGVVAKYLFTLIRILFIALTLKDVLNVFGMMATNLRYLENNKKNLIYSLVFYLIYYFISMFIYPYARSFLILLDVIAAINLALYSFSLNKSMIDEFIERAENYKNEKDTIIRLMREVSLIMGAGELDLDKIANTILDSAVRGVSGRGGAIYLKEGKDTLIAKYIKGLFPSNKELFKGSIKLNETILHEKLRAEKIHLNEGLIGTAASGKVVFIPDTAVDPEFKQTISELITITSYIAVPLRTKEEIFGVMAVVSDSIIFQDNDLSLIETLSEQAAITIKQIQMYQQILIKKQDEKEVQVAGQIQASLVPQTFPNNDKIDIYAFSIPAKGVGGDYYDYIDFGNNKYAITMFDVSGKGVPASLIMVMIRSILRTIADLKIETNEIISRLNNFVAKDTLDDRYATGFYLLLDADKGIMSYTNAGHGPLVLYKKKTNSFEYLDTAGMPVGIMEGTEYGEEITTMESGDIGFLYTDGITEAMNSKHEEFGMKRFEESIRKYAHLSAKEIANNILKDINAFVDGAPQHDDETLLVFKKK